MGAIRKYYFIPIVCIFVVSVLYWIISKRNDRTLVTSSISQSIKKASIPDQIEKTDRTHLENINMLSEGSQYGVQYYNEIAEENMEMKKMNFK